MLSLLLQMHNKYLKIVTLLSVVVVTQMSTMKLTISVIAVTLMMTLWNGVVVALVLLIYDYEASNNPKVIGAERTNIVADMEPENDYDRTMMTIIKIVWQSCCKVSESIHDRLWLEYSELNYSINKITEFWLKRLLSQNAYWINEYNIPDICLPEATFDIQWLGETLLYKSSYLAAW